MEIIKKYVLANEEAQKYINLRKYVDEISNAVFDAIGDEDETTVTTCSDCFFTDLDRPFTEEEELEIEYLLRDSDLNKYRTEEGVIFKCIDVLKKELLPEEETQD